MLLQCTGFHLPSQVCQPCNRVEGNGQAGSENKVGMVIGYSSAGHSENRCTRAGKSHDMESNIGVTSQLDGKA